MVYVFYLLVCIFALYGVLSMITAVADLIPVKENIKGGRTRLLLLVKDCEDNIEALTRGLYTGRYPGKFPGGQLTVVDMDSGDNTSDILRKLQRKYEGIEVINKDQFEEIFSHFEE